MLEKIGKVNYKYHVLIVIACCGFAAAALGLVSDSTGIFFKSMSESLGVGIGEIAMYITITSIIQALTCPVVGMLINRIDIRKMCVSFIMLTILALVIIASSKNLISLYLGAIVLGVGLTGFSVIPINVLLSNWFFEKTGIIVGITFAFSGIAGAIFSPVFNYLIEEIGWRYTYLIMTGLVAIFTLPGAFIIRLYPKDVGCIPYGKHKNIQINDDNKGAPNGLSIISISFMWTIICGILITIVIGLSSHIPTLAVVSGLSASVGAMMMSYTMASNVVFKLVLGYMRDHIGIIKSLIIYTVIVVIGVFGLFYLGKWPAILQYVAPICFGSIYAISAVGIPLLTEYMIGEKNFARSYSYITTCTTVVYAIMVSVFGFTYDISGTYAVSILITIVSAIVLLLILLVIYFRKVNKNQSIAE